jgi:glycosyltransferase involved in cell wall biosynthesis
MRILLVANYEQDGQESMARYAAWLERLLKARGHEVTVARPRVVFSGLFLRPGLKKYFGYLDKYLLFSPRLRRLARPCELVHVLDHSNSMYLRAVRQKPNLITCHDVLAIRAARGEFSQVSIAWTGRLLQRWILSGLCKARHVLCVSAKTAHDLKALIESSGGGGGKNGPELRVVGNPLNWSYRPGAALQEDLASRLGFRPGDRYFLHVGGNQWYKNRLGALRIFARLVEGDSFPDARLVMAGKPWSAAMKDVIREERLEGRVIEAMDTTNEELQALYCNAIALLFPSLEEGFGWPILEAQACGCPVIASRRPPLTEVAGEAAIFIDPAEPQVVAAAIVKGLMGREQLRAAGFKNLERFNQEAIVDQYCAFYAAILAEG